MRSSRFYSNTKYAILFLKIVIAVLLLTILIRYALIDLQKLPALLYNPFPLIVSVILMVIAIWANAMRWSKLLTAMSETIHLRHGLRMLYISAFASTFLPGSSSGDAIRMILSIRYGIKASRATISIVLDRIFGVVLGAIVFILFSVLYWDIVKNYQILKIVVSLVAFILFFAISISLISYHWGHKIAGWIRGDGRGKFQEFIAGVLDGMQEVAHSPSTLLAATFWSIFIQLLMITVSFILATVLGFTGLSFGQLAIAFNGGLLTSVIPITPGGIGIGEAAFDQICRVLSGSSMAYASIFFSFRIVKMIVSLPGGIYLLYEKKHSHLEYNVDSN